MKLKLKQINWVLISIILIAAAFRFYKIRDYIVFLGDEGRDALIVRDILRGNLTLLGPTASVGGFYLGPIYYYMMAPFLLASSFDPVGPAYMIATIGVATVYLVYWFGKKYFHPIAGLSAAFLYAISPLTVRYSRASWNPNPLPFFTLIGILFLTHGITRKKKLSLFLAGASLGITWQLHYLALVLNAVFLVIILDVFKRNRWLSLKLSRKKIKLLLSRSLIVFLGWITTFSPFLAFEIRHSFPNTRTVSEFITRPSGALDTKTLDIITTFYTRLLRIFQESFVLDKSLGTSIFAVVALLSLIYASRRRNKSLVTWFIVGLFGMSVYQGDIHDYYFGFLFPVPFLMTGIVVYLLWIRGKLGKFLASLGIIFLTWGFINRSFFLHPPNRIVDQTQMITEDVVELAGDEPYNFAMIAPGNSDHAYRYFLEVSDNPPKKLEEEVTHQLIIICEQPKETCEPRGNPLWEIAGFGRKEIAETRTSRIGNITIIKTIHHQSSLDMIGKPAKKGQ